MRRIWIVKQSKVMYWGNNKTIIEMHILIFGWILNNFYVLRNVGNGELGSEKRKFKNLKERILKEKDTLFYIVIDEGNKPLPQRYKPSITWTILLWVQFGDLVGILDLAFPSITNSFLSVAHFAPIPGKQIDNLINDKDVLEANNTIILQVSATPYNLVTKNTRLVSKEGLRIKLNEKKLRSVILRY